MNLILLWTILILIPIFLAAGTIVSIVALIYIIKEMKG